MWSPPGNKTSWREVEWLQKRITMEQSYGDDKIFQLSYLNPKDDAAVSTLIDNSKSRNLVSGHRPARVSLFQSAKTVMPECLNCDNVLISHAHKVMVSKLSS